jgi:type VI secretion system secreted protein VgrG
MARPTWEEALARFSCIPIALPYRPQRITRKPAIAGIQTATAVGPPGEEIFCDKYGRVKVQFHWDREGKKNADSSCAAQVRAGRGWDAFFSRRKRLCYFVLIQSELTERSWISE